MKPKITAFEIKNLDLPLISFVVKSPDLTLLKSELSQKLADMPDFFSGEPAVIDLTALHDEDLPELDLAGIKALLGTYHLQPWAIKSHQQQFIEMGQQLGLPEISAFLPSTTHSKKRSTKTLQCGRARGIKSPSPSERKNHRHQRARSRSACGEISHHDHHQAPEIRAAHLCTWWRLGDLGHGQCRRRGHGRWAYPCVCPSSGKSHCGCKRRCHGSHLYLMPRGRVALDCWHL